MPNILAVRSTLRCCFSLGLGAQPLACFMYVCMYVCMYACMYVSLSLYIYISIYIHIYTHIHMYLPYHNARLALFDARVLSFPS